MKRCSKCKEWKELEEFYNNRSQRDGKTNQCKACIKTNALTPYEQAYTKWQSQAHAEKRKDYWKKYYAENAERERERGRQNRAQNPEKRKQFNRKSLLRQYGLTPEMFAEKETEQNGKCAICGQTNNGKTLHVDHNHKTNAVRALLCTRCNNVLGQVDDDIDLLQALIAYIQKFSAAPPIVPLKPPDKIIWPKPIRDKPTKDKAVRPKPIKDQPTRCKPIKKLPNTPKAKREKPIRIRKGPSRTKGIKQTQVFAACSECGQTKFMAVIGLCWACYARKHRQEKRLKLE